MTAKVTVTSDMDPRERCPVSPTDLADPLPWRVWVESPAVDDDPRPWKLVASFRFLPEALDYLRSISDRGACPVFQSPNGVVAY